LLAASEAFIWRSTEARDFLPFAALSLRADFLRATRDLN